MLRQSDSAKRQDNLTRQADSVNRTEKVPPTESTKPAPTEAKPNNDKSIGSEAPGDPKKAVPNKVEIARGQNDLSELLGKGARLDRHDIGDTLTFPDGRKVSVTKDRNGISVRENAVGEGSDLQQIIDPKDPYVKLKNGAIIKFNASGQLDALSCKGKVYVFQRPGF